VKAKSLLSRLSGISVSASGVGVSWKPAEPERDVIRAVITFLEDKRALYVPHDVELADYVNQAMLQIRDELTKAIAKLDDKSRASESLRIMRGACRTFMTETGAGQFRHRGHFDRDDGQQFFIKLGMLRAIFGQQLAVLGYLYNIDIEEGLASILPPEPG
jgi:hypothetical protein